MRKEGKYPEWILWGVVLVWGANYVVGKYGMAGFAPLTFNVLRFIGATPLLFLLLYLLEKDLTIELRDWPHLALIGLVGITLYQTLFMATVKYASATNASLLLAVSPVFTALFTWITGQERLGFKGLWGSGLAFLGVVLVILFGANKLATGWDVWRGDFFGILATTIWGFYPVVTRPMLNKYSALKTTTYSALFATLLLLLIGIPGLLKVTWYSVPLESWGSLLFSIGPVTAYGLVAWYHAISRVGSNRVMAYMYAIPVVAVITAAVILGERIHSMQVLGAAVIFTGIYFIRQDKQASNSSNRAVRQNEQGDGSPLTMN